MMFMRIQELLEPFRDLSILSIFIRYTLTVILGGVIGIERGKKRHAAGLRTHLVVCIGAASVMMVSQYIFLTMSPDADPGRMGAQVISGIGFLGVGTIVVTGRNQVKGLTTAAGLWASACMGLAIGIGFYEGAVLMCLFLYLVLEVLTRLDDRYIKYANSRQFYLEYEKNVHFGKILQIIHAHGWNVAHMEALSNQGEYVALMLSINHEGKNDDDDWAVLVSELKLVPSLLCVEEL